MFKLILPISFVYQRRLTFFFYSSYLCSQSLSLAFQQARIFYEVEARNVLIWFGLWNDPCPIFSRTMSSWKRSGTGSSEPLRPASQQSHPGTLRPATSPKASLAITTQTGQLITASTHLNGLKHNGCHVPKAQPLPVSPLYFPYKV